eukprot:14659034-Ditylum_brightwellii.AAC.1
MEVHALAFMPCMWPLRDWLGSLNQKGGHAKGDPPLQKTCVAQKGVKREHHLWFLEGVGWYYT